MMELKLGKNMTMELTQQGDFGDINVDVCDNHGDIEYCFEIPASELIELLNEYQRKNGII